MKFSKWIFFLVYPWVVLALIGAAPRYFTRAGGAGVRATFECITITHDTDNYATEAETCVPLKIEHLGGVGNFNTVELFKTQNGIGDVINFTADRVGPPLLTGADIEGTNDLWYAGIGETTESGGGLRSRGVLISTGDADDIDPINITLAGAENNSAVIINSTNTGDAPAIDVQTWDGTGDNSLDINLSGANKFLLTPVTDCPATCLPGTFCIDSNGNSSGTNCGAADGSPHLCICQATDTYFALDLVP